MLVGFAVHVVPFLGPESGSTFGGPGSDTAPCVSRLRPHIWVPEIGPLSLSAFQAFTATAGAPLGSSLAARLHGMASPEPSLTGSGSCAGPAAPVAVSSVATKRPPPVEEVEAFATRKLQVTVARSQANLSARGMMLSDESLRPLYEVPALKALQLIQGIDGPQVRDPARLLAWNLRQGG